VVGPKTAELQHLDKAMLVAKVAVVVYSSVVVAAAQQQQVLQAQLVMVA
jgi:hypothetical protein